MSKCHLEPNLVPRNGRVLRAMGIARISTVNQDPKSLDDQQALLRKWVEDRFDGDVQWKFSADQASGELMDRHQVTEAGELVETGQYDLVIMEDLSRYMRRFHAVGFCELCEDEDTRLIAINDNIDTAKEWRLHAFFAAMKHEQSNKDTSERIKRTLRNRFQQGEVVQVPIFGYIKTPGAKHDSQLQKDPAVEPIYREWFQRLDEGVSFSEIADWLNAAGIPLGPYCRRKEWDCRIVGRITRNPILKGVRIRNRMKSRRNRKGRYRSVKARPEELLERHCPHLAFFEAAYYDRVVAKVNQRNAKYRRGKDGHDPRKNVPKKRTRFPGQTIYCGVCGRLCVFGAHGQTDHLVCTGVREYHCWNSVSVDGPLAARKISEAVLAQIESLRDFDQVFLDLVNEEARRLDGARDLRLRELDTAIESRKREIENLLKFICGGGDGPSVHRELRRIEQELEQLQYDKDELEDTPNQTIDIPSADQLKCMAREAFQGLSLESFEFARLMRSLISKVYVFPYRPCDGGNPVLRARCRLQLANLLPEKKLQQALAGPLERELTLDLFEPPQRVEYRELVLARRSSGETEAQVAKSLRLTITAAQRAAALDRLMKEHGLADPYMQLTEPPEDFGRMRLHLHPRYRFEPLPEYRPE